MKFSYLILITVLSCQIKVPEVTTLLLPNATDALLQAVSIVDEKVTWVSGQQATFGRTKDQGETWQIFQHPSDTLQFRDIHAFDADHIILMSAGQGSSSRIMLFDTPTNIFTESYVMPYEKGFLNTIEFWDAQRGLAFGDSFNNELFILKTDDGGQTWDRIDPEKLPSAGTGEGGFAASGTCISVTEGGNAFIGTGAGGVSQILISSDFGESWESRNSPMIKGEMAGIFSIRMMDKTTGMIAGGDLSQMEAKTNNLFLTSDQWLNSVPTNQPFTTGPLYGSDLINIKGQKLAIICGPAGIDYSLDFGKHWVNLDSGNYWSVKMHVSGYGYAVGTDGKIMKIDIN
ncbi:MAG: photosystem II stability/assembly factor-like uncharacterized protein [Cyclobacteriaceae bacterium]|jgi:photosystem II stability/assembly factor-like uncharacterized protein